MAANFRLNKTPQNHAGNTPYRLLDAWRGVAALWVVMLHVHLDSTPYSTSPIQHWRTSRRTNVLCYLRVLHC